MRAMIAAWSKALEAKDAAGLVADYDPETVLYDVKPPHKITGPAAIRSMWENCLPHLPDRFTSEHRDLTLTVGRDLAVMHALHAIHPVGTDHPAAGMWIRVSACYRKTAGRWRVMHEHVSVPFDPTTGKVVAIRGP
ncbi:MAG: YybH family protein [Hyphomicrobiaceae bacterium]